MIENNKVHETSFNVVWLFPSFIINCKHEHDYDKDSVA